jgi:putative ABC transport system permease protein
MLQNYLKIAFRNLWRNKIYTTINIVGLSIGVTSCLLIFLWLQDEMSYDQQYLQKQNIYRVTMDWHGEGGKITPVATSQTFASDYMPKLYPEVQHLTRVYYGYIGQEFFLRIGENKFYEENIRFVDSAFFKVFQHEFIAGNPQKALENPNSIILTRTLAEKYFGSVKSALDKNIQLDQEIPLKVSGVVEDCPHNAHLQFRAIIPINLLKKFMGEYWQYAVFWTYITTPQSIDYQVLDAKIAKYSEKQSRKNNQSKSYYVVHLQPIKDIHLHSTHLEGDTDNSNIVYVYAFTAIAIFILLIASVNYINLATARATERAKEVGVRKVVGSAPIQLIYQFLFESMVLCSIAMALSINLLELVLPYFNQLTNKPLAINYSNLAVWLSLGGFALLIALLSGLYPAFVLSSFKPVLVLKGKVSGQQKGLVLRQGLVVFQFMLSLTIIICTWATYQQLNFMLNQDLGFKKEQIVVLPLQDGNLNTKVSAIKQEILKSPDIQQVSSASYTPGTWGVSYAPMYAQVEGSAELQGLTDVTNYYVDEEYLPTMEMKLLMGRNFDKARATDAEKAVIINETLAKKLGWKNPIGKELQNRLVQKNCKIIGVVKDIHFKSLHKKVEPMALFYNPQGLLSIMVKINEQKTDLALAHLQKVWQKFDPNHPFKHFFLDQNFLKNYRSDQNRASLFIIFSLLTVFIACLGLFGLVSFTTLKRAKEISIRKVLGASVSSIMLLLSKDFIRLVIIASIIALPIAYWAMQMILQNYAYRIELGFGLFFLPILMVLAIAIITLSYQTFKASAANPVDNLRYE